MKISISGIRGIFGNDLTLKDVLRFCNNFSSLVKSKKCVIGHDTRPSYSMMLDTASAALLQNGIDVYNLGMMPTPVIFRESRKYQAGVIVTSSHNPTDWNGLKFIIDGRGINEDELKTLTNDDNASISEVGTETKIESDYVQEASKLIGNVSGTPKVVVDIGGGAAKNVAPELLKKIGCQVEVINDSLENCSRGPDPTSDDLNDLISKCNDAVGFAFDLDGDRLVVVKDGKKLSPDITLGLGVVKALELGYKKFVLSIDSSIAVEKFILEKGGEVQRSKVGEANVIDLMIKTNSQAGGEGSSGGFILPEFNYCRDGILTSGFIASMLGQDNFENALKFFEKYQQVREKVSIEASLHDRILEKLTQKMSEEFEKVITIDGVKAIVDENSWVLVRKSNTEDIIRISGESDNLEKVKTIVEQTRDLVKQSHDEVK
ncbi:MAG: phosphomannomutase [Nitrososphaeria archaeon]|nr:phosphomannomutase [Nitrosopumilaceae archaeon]NIP09758.1 phosphomannomutase [Nitrosopumilaceae archaeon]NIP91305.1 phosphomannomutase [Nitrososphaeria archaeon]NIS95817.1 phosphomannomutase [Nitrosopumilaceae archaeon]